MTVVQIRSPHNPLIRTVRLIGTRSKRAPEELVLAEGLRVLEDTVRSGCRITAAIISEGFGGDHREESLIRSLQNAGTRLYRTTDRLLRSLSEVVEPQGVIGLVTVPHLKLADVVIRQQALILCLCGLQDPGNLGTLIRTAVAAGVSMICTTPVTVSARNPKAVRASAGAFFRARVVERVTPEDLLEFCRFHGLTVYRTDAGRGIEYHRANLGVPLALLLGNESRGFRDEDWRRIPALRIPLLGGVESLNVGTAGAVILFEALRQRHMCHREPAAAHTAHPHQVE